MFVHEQTSVGRSSDGERFFSTKSTKAFVSTDNEDEYLRALNATFSKDSSKGMLKKMFDMVNYFGNKHQKDGLKVAGSSNEHNSIDRDPSTKHESNSKPKM